MNLNSQYPDYRDSGISWLGRIPAHWNLTKLKHEAPFQVGWTPPTKNDANFEGDNLWANISDLKSKVIRNTAKRISDDAAAAASMEITPKGSLLYSFKLSVGAVAFAGTDMYTNEAIASFLDNSRLPLDYLYYAFPIFVIQNAATNIYGARILNQDLIKNADLLAPSFGEASLIAKFLDYETAKIDALIEKQQQLIALLKEKRQAVISHAVTKGLNPNAPMRDSGVEWLGEVPAHWEVVQLRRLLTSIEQGSSPLASAKPPEVGGQGVLKISAIKAGMFKESEAKSLDGTPFEEAYRVRQGDLLVTRGNTPDLVADACVVREEPNADLMMSDLIYRLNVSDRAQTRFLCFWLLSSYGRLQIKNDARGSSMTMAKVAQGHIKAWLATLPPKDEQERIVDHIEHLEKSTSALLDQCEAMMERLQERRAALISAAVTGKIDVRNWSPPKPQADTEVA